MVWTNPPTYTTAQVLTAALMNDISGNLDILKTSINDDGTLAEFVKARTTAVFSKTSDVVPADVPGLTFPVAANDIWMFMAFLYCTVPTTPDMRLAITLPSGGTGRFGVMTSRNEVTIGGQTTIGTDLIVAGGTLDFVVILSGTAVISTTPGSADVQMAQGTSNGTATTIHENSSILAVRL